MPEWFLGMGASLTLLITLFNPRSFLFAVVTLFVVAFLFPGIGLEYSVFGGMCGAWIGLLAEIYHQTDFDK